MGELLSEHRALLLSQAGGEVVSVVLDPKEDVCPVQGQVLASCVLPVLLCGAGGGSALSALSNGSNCPS